MSGGQRRTIIAECGWTRVGHPNEVNKLFKLHKKYCKDCSDTDYEPSKDAFHAIKTNGWKGLMPNGQKPNQIKSKVFMTTLNTGMNLDIITDATSIADCYKKVNELIGKSNNLDF